MARSDCHLRFDAKRGTRAERDYLFGCILRVSVIGTDIFGSHHPTRSLRRVPPMNVILIQLLWCFGTELLWQVGNGGAQKGCRGGASALLAYAKSRCVRRGTVALRRFVNMAGPGLCKSTTVQSRIIAVSTMGSWEEARVKFVSTPFAGCDAIWQHATTAWLRALTCCCSPLLVSAC